MRGVLVVLLVVALGACAPAPPAADPAPDRAQDHGPPAEASRPDAPPPDSAETPAPDEFLPGLGAVVDLPDGPASAVAVLVPGGGWRTADPGGLAPLGQRLVDEGVAVVTVTYGTASTGAVFPEPAADVGCAVAYAAEAVPDVPVVALGHSAGAHLVALVGLVPQWEGDCPYAPAAADAVVGLAGPYDLAATQGLARPLVGAGPEQDPDAWREANPVTWADERPQVPFLLVHGLQDGVVPPSFSREFAQVLEGAGHDVQVAELTGVDHMQVLDPGVVGDAVSAWVHRTVLDDR